MEITRVKRIYETKGMAMMDRLPDEVVVPISDTVKTIGWELVPVGTYVSERYGTSNIPERRGHPCWKTSVTYSSELCSLHSASDTVTKKKAKREEQSA